MSSECSCSDAVAKCGISSAEAVAEVPVHIHFWAEPGTGSSEVLLSFLLFLQAGLREFFLHPLG